MRLIARISRRLFPNDLHHMDGFSDAVDRYMLHSRCALDLGCGDNSILARYRSSDREVWGTDFASHPHLQNAEWFRLLDNKGNIPFPDATFDIVVCISVLEHVTDRDAFFREVARVLKPSGYFIGHSISGDHYVTWIRRAFGWLLPHSVNQLIVKKMYGRDEVDTFPAYYRVNNKKTIAQAARTAGFTLLDLNRYADQNYFSFWRPLWVFAMGVDRILAQISSSWGRLYFTAVLQKN